MCKPALKRIIKSAIAPSKEDAETKTALSIRLRTGPTNNPNNSNQTTSGILVLSKIIEPT